MQVYFTVENTNLAATIKKKQNKQPNN